MNDLEQKALLILARVASKDVAELDVGQDLVGDLGIDSPKALQLVCDLEDDCGIDLPDETVGTMETVGDMLTIVRTAAPLPS